MKKIIIALAALLSSVSLLPAQQVLGTPSRANITIVGADPTNGGTCANPGYVNINWLGGAIWQCGAPANTNLNLPFTNKWAKIGGSPGLTPGIGTAIASATTIAPITRYVHITGTTAIVNITAPTGTVSGTEITLIFDGVDTWTAAGNIAAAGSATTAGSTVTFVYDAVTAKFYPSRVS